ncbi:Cyclic di-GMP phosphodiesterase Gmr [Caulifigura coniformis]|uniref:Cyclic di-GMP phosphodiesterase Gmr n=1 Tax=Caulifigura coniformis TaxID=2527983 RepID=A0A517SMY9_9PLAN|nr:EAL domain-containing protein [Caulifigura coniformis]QDT57466.1 Cyclic di-GMP phosphodiesterase Gmr [Caulifigura coniformis]
MARSEQLSSTNSSKVPTGNDLSILPPAVLSVDGRQPVEARRRVSRTRPDQASASARTKKRRGPAEQSGSVDSVEQLALVLQHACGFVALVGDGGRVERASGAVYELLTPDMAVDRLLGDTRLGIDAPEFLQRVERSLLDGKEDHFEWFNPVCDRWIVLHLAPAEEGVMIVGFDITRRRILENSAEQQRAQLAYQADYDAATKLLNRRAFQALVEQACQNRRGAGFSIMLIDIDGFQAANDTFGHVAGDALLLEVADRLRTCIGENDVLARLGNDEFAVLHCGGRTSTKPERLITRIMETIHRPFLVSGTKVSLTASIGVAIAPQDGDTQEALFQAADIAVKWAKRDGGEGWRRFEISMQTELQTRHEVHEGLIDALAAGQMLLHYQPVIDIRHGLVSGLESRFCWNHPREGLLPPERFLHIAEASGSIVPLGEWAILNACRDAMAWPAHCEVAVNLSPRQFRSNIVRTVSQALGESRIESSRLVLEVCEAVLVDRPEKNLDSLQRLRALGVKIVFDGLGTGCASLRHLQLFPFDRIKIDRSMIHNVGIRRDSEVIVRSMVGLAHDLGIQVVAKGVETPEELRRLRETGCHQAQGDLFCRPVPVATAFEYLRRCAAGNSGVSN